MLYLIIAPVCYARQMVCCAAQDLLPPTHEGFIHYAHAQGLGLLSFINESHDNRELSQYKTEEEIKSYWDKIREMEDRIMTFCRPILQHFYGGDEEGAIDCWNNDPWHEQIYCHRIFQNALGKIHSNYPVGVFSIDEACEDKTGNPNFTCSNLLQRLPCGTYFRKVRAINSIKIVRNPDDERFQMARVKITDVAGNQKTLEFKDDSQFIGFEDSEPYPAPRQSPEDPPPPPAPPEPGYAPANPSPAGAGPDDPPEFPFC